MRRREVGGGRRGRRGVVGSCWGVVQGCWVSSTSGPHLQVTTVVVAMKVRNISTSPPQSVNSSIPSRGDRVRGNRVVELGPDHRDRFRVLLQLANPHCLVVVHFDESPKLLRALWISLWPVCSFQRSAKKERRVAPALMVPLVHVFVSVFTELPRPRTATFADPSISISECRSAFAAPKIQVRLAHTCSFS